MIAYLMVASCVLVAAGFALVSIVTTRKHGAFTLTAHALRALAIGFGLTGGAWASAIAVTVLT